MMLRSRRDAVIRSLVILCSVLCGIGATASLYVVLVRVPALANTKLDTLFGTLQGVAVGLLFAIAALLTNLTHLLWRANRPSPLPQVCD
ncbi:hypothetical protein SAMN05444166_6904 [Singulisphaera sp. GP187]|uniref:hypothetical protein n=1 Tax=Singulisphaera sp. GP187 TaxID=1882752 RepID=UPI00092C9EE0|nr:hypothetical protein [Singulisphaera sp. GP187]SIO61951.1 hypothetical protein SAMN05444166_6904 [Singulisphaera sp. GP187]